MQTSIKAALVFAFAIGAMPAAFADDAHHPKAAPVTAQAAQAYTDGEVRKVNKDVGKITIKHEELKNLGMPPMTMVFRVKDPAMLDQLKVGDKIRFVAQKVGSQYTVTALEKKQ